MEARIKDCCFYISSDKVTDRKKYALVCLELLSEDNELQKLDEATSCRRNSPGDIDWNTLFKAATDFFTKETTKLQSEEDAAPQFSASKKTSRENNKKLCSSLMKTVIKHSCRGGIMHLDMDSFLDHIFDVFNSPLLNEYFGHEYMVLLARDVLPQWGCWTVLKLNDWLSLLVCILRIWKESLTTADATSKVTMADLLCIIMEKGYAQSDFTFVNRLAGPKIEEFLINIVEESRQKPINAIEDAILRLALTYTKTVSSDFPSLLCRFGQATLRTVLALWNHRLFQRKVLIIDFLKLQLAAHTSNYELRKAENWYRCLFRIKDTLEKAMLYFKASRQQNNLEEEFPPDFFPLAADVTFYLSEMPPKLNFDVTPPLAIPQSFMSSTLQSSAFSTQMIKRRKLVSNCEELLDMLIEESPFSCFPWLCLVTSLIHRHSADFIKTVQPIKAWKSLSKLITAHRRLPTFPQVLYLCRVVLVHSAAPKPEEMTEFQSFWQLLLRIWWTENNKTEIGWVICAIFLRQLLPLKNAQEFVLSLLDVPIKASAGSTCLGFYLASYALPVLPLWDIQKRCVTVMNTVNVISTDPDVLLRIRFTQFVLSMPLEDPELVAWLIRNLSSVKSTPELPQTYVAKIHGNHQGDQTQTLGNSEEFFRVTSWESGFDHPHSQSATWSTSVSTDEEMIPDSEELAPEFVRLLEFHATMLVQEHLSENLPSPDTLSTVSKMYNLLRLLDTPSIGADLRPYFEQSMEWILSCLLRWLRVDGFGANRNAVLTMELCSQAFPHLQQYVGEEKLEELWEILRKRVLDQFEVRIVETGTNSSTSLMDSFERDYGASPNNSSRVLDLACILAFRGNNSQRRKRLLATFQPLEFAPSEKAIVPLVLQFLSRAVQVPAGSWDHSDVRTLLLLVDQVAGVYSRDQRVLTRLLGIISRVWDHVGVLPNQAEKLQAMDLLKRFYAMQKEGMCGAEVEKALWSCMFSAARHASWAIWMENSVEPGVTLVPIFLEAFAGLSSPSPSVCFHTAKLVQNLMTDTRETESELKMCDWLAKSFEILKRVIQQKLVFENCQNEVKVARRTVIAQLMLTLSKCPCLHYDALHSLMWFSIKYQADSNINEEIQRTIAKTYAISYGRFIQPRAQRLLDRRLRENTAEMDTVAQFLGCGNATEFHRTYQSCIVPHYFLLKSEDTLMEIANNLRIPVPQLLKNDFSYVLNKLLLCVAGAKHSTLPVPEARSLLGSLKSDLSSDWADLVRSHCSDTLANLLSYVSDESLTEDFFGNERHVFENKQQRISADQWLTALQDLQSFANCELSELLSLQNSRRFLQKCWSRISQAQGPHEQQPTVISFTLAVKLVLQMAQTNKNGLESFLYIFRLASFRAVQLLPKYPRAGLEVINYLCQTVTGSEHLLLPFVPRLLKSLFQAANAKNFQTHHQNVRKLLEWFIVEQSAKLEATLRLVIPPQECSFAVDLFRIRDANRNRTHSRTFEQELQLFLQTSRCEDAMHPAVIQRLTRSIRENRNGLDCLQKTDEESSLHACISVLRYYCRYGTPDVTETAAKCLGELGPIHLTNPCLQPFDARPKPWLFASQLPTENPLLFNLAETVLVHLFTMEKGSSPEEFKLAEKVIEAILASEEGNQIVNVAAQMGYAGLPYLRAYESNYIKPSSLKASKLNLIAFRTKVDCEQLWCPTFGSPVGKTWLGNILVTIFDCLSKEHTIGAHLIPVLSKNENLDIQLFPLVVHYLLTENFAEVRPILSKHLRMYFAQVVGNHSKGNERSDAEYLLREPNVSILVQLIIYLRSQQMPPNLQAIVRCPAGLARNFWLDLNLFHVAQAASFCNAHFSAVLLAELSCDALSPCTKQDEPIEEDLDFYRAKPDPLPSLISSCYSKLGVIDQGSEKEFVPSSLPTSSNLQDVREKLRHLQLNRTEELLANNSASIEDLQSHSSSYLKQWNLTNFGKESQSLSQGLIDSCRLRIVEDLTQGVPESISALYPSLVQLRQVTEAEVILSSSKESLMDCLHSWESQIDPQCGYEQMRLVLNNRYDILRRMAREDTSLENRVLEGYSHQANLAVFANHFIEADKILDISEALAKNRYASLFNLRLEKAKCCWSSGLETVALQLLKALIDDISKAAKPSLLPSLLELRGKWEDETRLSNGEMILRNFEDAVKLAIVEKQNALIPEARLTLAMYCDKQLQDMKKYVNTDAYQQRLKARETIAQEVKNLGLYKVTNTERGPLYLTKSSEVEQNEAEMFEERRKNLLKQAVENYLHVLVQIDVGADGHLQALFRLVALWMDNRLDDNVANLLQTWLPKIPSHQWIPLLPQLAARLVRQARPNMYHAAFPGLLQTIFVGVARQHPFHALPLLLAIGNSALEANAAKDSIEQDRIQTATAILSALKVTRAGKNARVSVLTAKMEKLYRVLIGVANMEPSSRVKFPHNHALLHLRDLGDVLIPTVEIPVKPDGNYNDVIGIASFGEQYALVDGVNAPKRVFCTGTDGKERSILVKGKDDLRQDAVMQQLFGIVNRFLERDTTTRDCKLRMQTYKVVPLSKLSGVIEWCENTTTLYELLGTENGLHARYFPQEITPDATCKLMQNVMQTAQLDKKVRMFEELLASFSPAMHYFFLEKFPNPAHWFEKRLAYTRSVAVASMVGYILGLGDRHMSNLLMNLQTAEVVHIDFGIAFEQGSLLRVPEIVPFRLTRDMVDGMGVMKTSGTFEKSCALTMQVLRKERASILTLLEVLLYDPMYLWIVASNDIAELQTKRKKAKHEKPSTDEEVNANASRVLLRVGRKLQGMEESTPFSVEGQIRALIRQACDPSFLCRMYCMWKPHM